MRWRLLAIAGLLLGSLVHGGEGARLVVEPEGFDFGRVRPGVELTTRFVLRNVGTDALVIERVAGDCGCVVVDGWQSRLAPGETTQLRISLRLRKDERSGRLVRRVSVKSNDTGRSVVSIAVGAEVVKP